MAIDIIHLLPDHIANQIAAGEVVQRPSSAVKELLENAVDAKASTIKLIVKGAGKTLVQVIDDGIGMSMTDARMAFERHATSKINSTDDLFNLNTKGFRGEALASIVAVSQVELNTATQEDAVGTQIKIEGSKIISNEHSATPKGTSIAIKNLFFNIPARRNFLKSDTVELRHIIDEFQRIALPHPNISFKMYHNGSEVFNLPNDHFKKRIIQIFGNKVEEKLVPVNENTNAINLSGFICKPEFAKKHRGEQFFFVNNRYIKSPFFHHAVVGAFEGLLKDKAQPGYFLKFEVDPKTIDINIHPTKTEAKFEDEQTIYAILKSAVKHSLGQYNISPTLDFSVDKSLEIPYSYSKIKEPSLPKLHVDRNYNPFERKNNTDKTAEWQSLYMGLNTSKLKMEVVRETQNLFVEDNNLQVQPVTFQVKKKYILTTIKSGLVIINQNRAHQRIMYERLKKKSQTEVTMQQLIFPVKMVFGKNDIEVLLEAREDLEAIGFLFDKIDEQEVTIIAIPSAISEKEMSSIFESIIADYREGIKTTTDIRDPLLKSICRSISVKNGVVLSKEEQEGLVNDLFSCIEPTLSPFNKKIFTEIKITDIEKKID